MLKRRKEKDEYVLFQNMGGHLAFADSCTHERKFMENQVNFVDIGICNQTCPNNKTCRIYWNRKERMKKAIAINASLINPETISEELNGKRG